MNLVNSATVSEVSAHLSLSCGDDARVASLMSFCVGRLMLRAAQRGEDWRTIATNGQLAHIADWLRSALINAQPWIENVDDRGRPRKLLKFNSVDGVVAEADKAMSKSSLRRSKAELGEDDETTDAKLSDGFSLVRLLTPAALHRESARMRHCIGDGAYDAHLTDERYRYLSLRDDSGKVHPTLEIWDGRVTQFHGKQNSRPLPLHVEKVIPYIRQNRLKVDVPAYHLGYVIDTVGRWHRIDALPEGLTVHGNLFLQTAEIAFLPQGLTVGGGLFLYNTAITELPDGLAVGSHLYLQGTGITVLPEGLTVGAEIHLQKTGIVALPQSLPPSTVIYSSDGKMTADEFRTFHSARNPVGARRSVHPA
ncbi:PcfJ domain-containing protein [Rhizobium sp. VS19-DR104.2]|uniref:PcfJ domain-containing protein n=1 Tax=unclassified Rhizobium TaxID=2613769 RepID=UPI001CC6B15A|nr:MULTISPECIES: PcfJ domain-containing protein [unclassified Rhizobium]MBZ5762408.1 PcfJ domain-containing protein [Rhizobium sp. VS19-DR96]MBZ5768441.1 PcfJ domain-containing protein [Rhizobium sp. VS19-DR129.2]MBZ5776095.1 PcfJ domain-containing protein [Rhizobium sp. VS19-DRK62.2]MBZ5786214.1 PcfJ domain-containing protein [Rhizobium sp. VS19-DR121]MBZ5804486.1 PcfJ domain-containing protein [Rhizobium sp. VS19-DR181]